MLFLTLMLLTSCGLSIDKKGLNDVMKNEIKFEQLVKDLVTLEGSELSEQAKKSLDLWIDAAIDFSSVAIDWSSATMEDLKKYFRGEVTESKQDEISHPFIKISYAIEKKLEDVYGEEDKGSEFRRSFRNINQNEWAQGHEEEKLKPLFSVIQNPTARFMEDMYEKGQRIQTRIVTPLYSYILCLCEHNVNINFLDLSKLEHLVEQESKMLLPVLEFQKWEIRRTGYKKLAEAQLAMSEAEFKVFGKFRIERIIIQIIKDYQEGKSNKIGEKAVPSFTAEDKKLLSDAYKKNEVHQDKIEQAIEEQKKMIAHIAELIKELVKFLTN